MSTTPALKGEVVQVQSDKVIEKTVTFEDIFKLVTGDLPGALSQNQGTIEANFDRAPEIRYVEAYLISIIKNLIGDAIKYCLSNRPVHISVSTQKVGAFVQSMI